MFAQVIDGTITSFPKGNKGLEIVTSRYSADDITADVYPVGHEQAGQRIHIWSEGDVKEGLKYPKSIYSLWTEAERNAIGIYTVEIDETNRKDETFYINTDITYAFGSGKVTGSYGTATAKAIADSLYTSQDNTDGLIPEGKSVGDVKQSGLKSKYKSYFNLQAASLLAKTDWYVIKAADVSDYSVPSNIATYRAAVRTKVNAMETAIDGCANVEALITLLEYTTDSDGVTSRPLGEFPDEVV
jgi:hypothetical protein